MRKLILLLLLFPFIVKAQLQPIPSGTLTTMATNQAYIRLSDSTYYVYNGTTYKWQYLLTLGQANKLYAPFGSSGVIKFNNRTGAVVPLTGDYSSFYPLLNGTGATGTWGINVTGNAGTATLLQTARTINGVSFNGGSNITITANTPNLLIPGYGLSGTAYDGHSVETWVSDTASSTGLVSKSRLNATNFIQSRITGLPDSLLNKANRNFNNVASGAIANVKLANSSLTIGSTNISLGSTSASLTGLTSIGLTNGAGTTVLSGSTTNTSIVFPALSGIVPIFAVTPVLGALTKWSSTLGALTNATSGTDYGTVSSVATNTGTGITGGTITTTGTIAADTAGVLAAKAYVNNFASKAFVASIYTPLTRSLTINGSAQTLAADRTWTITTTGTANKIDVSGGTGSTPTITISPTYVGQSSITTLGTIGTGVWNGALIGSTFGGSGINNAGTLTWGAGGTLGTAAYTNTGAYEVPLTFSTGLTRTTNTITNDLSTGISTTQSVIGGLASGSLTLKPFASATAAQSFVLDANGITSGGGTSTANVSFATASTFTNTGGTVGYYSKDIVIRTSNTSAAYGTFQTAMSIGSTNTANYTGAIGLHGFYSHTGFTAGAIGTVTNWDQYMSDVTNPSAMNVSNAYIFRGRAMSNTGGGTISGFAGLALNAITVGANNTYLLLGTNTIPTGNWGLYNNNAYNHYTGTGNFQIGSATATAAAEKLQVTGTGVVTSTFKVGSSLILPAVTAGTTADSVLVKNATTNVVGKLAISQIIGTGSFVPYSGATGAVTLGANDLSARAINANDGNIIASTSAAATDIYISAQALGTTTDAHMFVSRLSKSRAAYYSWQSGGGGNVQKFTMGLDANNNLLIGNTTVSSSTPLKIDTLNNITTVGNLNMSVAGNKLSIAEGTDGRVGQTTLVAGTKAITITGLTTSSRAFPGFVSQAGTSTGVFQYSMVCTANTLTITAVTVAGVPVVTDTSTLNYFIIN